ncbi:PilN domain-containing protein [Marinicellulosiphila megalodicopiae]|uniref:PilN domain-containing protein n=1 Tax=Marinicellulosiphila megalodicopiae TaxID=2724896 RepID=UPI003BAE8C7D
MSSIHKSQVNLYRENEIQNNVKFSTSALFKLFIFLMVVFVSWNAFLYIQLNLAKVSTQQAFIQQQNQYQILIDYQQQFPNKITSLNLTNVLEAKQSILAEKQMIFDALTFSENSSFIGFYLYFDALAKADINNLWLTNFTFSDAMQSMKINGVAKKATDVTDYLKSLQQTIFSGSTFNGIQLFPLNETQNAISFEISTSQDFKVSKENTQKNVTIKTPKWSSLEENSIRAKKLSDSLIGGEQ